MNQHLIQGDPEGSRYTLSPALNFTDTRDSHRPDGPDGPDGPLSLYAEFTLNVDHLRTETIFKRSLGI